MKRNLVLAVIGAAVLGTLVWAYNQPGKSVVAPRFSSRTIGVLRIEGPIVSGSSGSSLLGGSFVGSDPLVGLLREARQSAGVKAVVLRINSPGGTAAGAQEIGAEVRRLRESGTVVVAAIGDIGASGAYWIASQADVIVANPSSEVGSIGVIMQLVDYQELYRKIGLGVTTIKSGPLKDIGSPFRDMTERERALLQGMVDDIFDQFVTVVSEGRRMDRAAVLAVADGSVFTGRQAKAAGLVDELGSMEEAIKIAADRAGLGDSYQVSDLERRTPFELFLESLGSTGQSRLGGAPWLVLLQRLLGTDAVAGETGVPEGWRRILLMPPGMVPATDGGF